MNHPLNRRSLVKLVLVIAAICAVAIPAIAVDVSGSVSGNWTRGFSPYRIVGDITVPPDSALFIEAGVDVVYTGPYAIYVNNGAALRVRGDSIVGSSTSLDTVMFQTDPAVTDTLQWGRGIRFTNANNFSEIRYAKFARLRASGVWPENNGGALYVEGCSPKIKFVEFYRCKAAFYGGAMHFWFSSSTVEHALIDSCNAIEGGGGVDMWFSTITFKFVTAVSNYIPLAIQTNGGAILVGSSSNLSLSHCVLYRNELPLDSGIAKIGDGSAYVARYSYWRAISASNGNVSTELNSTHWTQTPPWSPSIVSPLIDAGDPNEPVGAELLPNGGRVNVGYYGQTSLATKSVAVAEIFPSPIDTIKLGDLKIGKQISATKRFRNIGRAPLAPLFIKNMHSDNSIVLIQYGDSLVTQIDSLRPLYPDSTFELKVYWRPTTIGVQRSHITWRWNDRDTNYVYDTIVVQGNGINPRINVNVDTLNFGERSNYSRDTLRAVLSNSGTTELSVSAISVGSVFDGGFGSTLTGAARIPVDSTKQLNVTFEPDNVGYFAARLSIVNNDSLRSIYVHGYSRGSFFESDTFYHAGFVPQGSTRDYQVRVYNNGNATLQIDSVVFNNPIVRANFTSPILIGIADTVLQRPDTGFIPIVFAPTALRTDTVRGIVYTNDGKLDTIRIIGRGIQYGEYISNSITGILEPATSGIPYVITGEVSIPRTSTLRIRPDVHILFEPGSSLKVEGTIIAEGTQTQPIVFSAQDSSNFRTPFLVFNETSGDNKLSFVTITGPDADITVRQPMITATRSNFTLDHCSIIGGNATDGAVMKLLLSNAKLVRCELRNHTATNGGVIALVDSRATTIRSVFADNRATGNGGVIHAGNGSEVISYNDLFLRNHAAYGGVVAMFDNSEATVNNSVFHNNISDSIATIGYMSQSVAKISSSIITGTQGSVDFAGPLGSYSNPLISFSLIERSNSAYTPLALWNNDTVNFQLVSGAQAIDAGDPNPSKNDYWFPPAMGTARNDAGLTGGPKSGEGELNAMGILLMDNPGIGALPDVAIYRIDPNVTVDSLQFVPTSGTPQYLPLTVLPNGTDIYRSRITTTGSATVTAIGHNTANPAERYRVTRLVGVVQSGTMAIGPWTVGVSEGAGFVRATLAISSEATGFGPDIEIGASSNRIVTLTFDGELPGGQRFALLKQSNGNWMEVASVTRSNGSATADVTGSGTYRIMAVEDLTPVVSLPTEFALSDAFPNPFNPVTSLKLSAPIAGYYRVTVYDLLGRTVAVLLNSDISAGTHTLRWNATTSNGAPVAAGIYWVKAESAANSAVRKLVLMK
ncbi:MAG: T9SS type A sorting domain-containing protein [bacterium]|nr:T9SS type A sorting domain-containing protein [bacterium]